MSLQRGVSKKKERGTGDGSVAFTWGVYGVIETKKTGMPDHFLNILENFLDIPDCHGHKPNSATTAMDHPVLDQSRASEGYWTAS